MEIPWHDGERKLHALLSAPVTYNPTQPLLTAGAANRFASSPLIAVGARDAQNRPWATVWGGQAGVAEPLGDSILGVTTEVDAKHDPVIQALFGDEDGVVEITGGKMMRKHVLVSGLAIDLERRLRWKMAGTMLAGGVVSIDDAEADMDSDQEPAEARTVQQASHTKAQIVIQVTQSLGNCPKYLNKKHIRPASTSRAHLIEAKSSDPADLPPEALALIDKADLFFVSSFNENTDTDTNHRGGPPSFVRVQRSSHGATATTNPTHPEAGAKHKWELIWPEYSGNRLYQTLGNLAVTPKAGLVFPDFVTGDVLYVTGDTEILFGKDAADVITHSNLAVRIKITAARFVRQGLPFRGDAMQMSPYNPRVRLLASEAKAVQNVSGRDGTAQGLTATLLSQTKLTPTISRFRFTLSNTSTSTSPHSRSQLTWTPGQWVALDFSHELDIGYSHMREDDPRSLNDDFIRTFTVSSPPPNIRPTDVSSTATNVTSSESETVEFEITIRNVGPATSFLFRVNPRAETVLPVLGFGGGEDETLIQPPVVAGDSEVSVQTAEVLAGSNESSGRVQAGDGLQGSTMPLLVGGSGTTSQFGINGSSGHMRDPVTPFVAGGIGITPLLSQLGVLDYKRLRVFWSVSANDLGLVTDVLDHGPEWLGSCMHVFVSGDISKTVEENQAVEEQLYKIRNAVKVLEVRRVKKGDLLSDDSVAKARRWVVCAGQAFRQMITGWLEEEEIASDGGERQKKRMVVFEDFNF